ncbi:GTPase HflX|uniref:GTPase HflX n=1 Tax=Neochlamydia sp. AcF84 TaxID=2315858 RepID=UPI00140E02F8|nr:GTPase HflX [Neochlamydia sp. AcF84]NGY95681.1 GTPase HflX [Neochlamydia sp. AcF84]
MPSIKPKILQSSEDEFQQPKKALLVSVYKGSNFRPICEEHLDELALLAETYGIHVNSKIPCMVRKYDASTFVTEGKLQELLRMAQEQKVDLIIFDDEITPGQQRNLENIFNMPVIDRTGVILEVFAQRAHTKEARLQIELAKIKYQAPRLKRLWSHLSRQAGTGGKSGGAYLKGEGEKQIEIDKRILKKQMDSLQNEIREVRANRLTQRTLRTRLEIPVFAIIGYTNAGKSTLLNALTDAKVFVEDKLFATLDTTTRKYLLPNNQEILLIDTVGFIRKLPHLLVAAFKSTLEEALQADILIHLVDISHPMAEEQAATTYEVLKELKAENKPIITVLNKIDRCTDPQKITRLRILYPKSVSISALNKIGFEDLLEQMIQELNRKRTSVTLKIPQLEYHKVSEVMRLGNIIHQDYEDNDVLIRVDLPCALAGKLKDYIIEGSA